MLKSKKIEEIKDDFITKNNVTLLKILIKNLISYDYMLIGHTVEVTYEEDGIIVRKECLGKECFEELQCHYLNNMFSVDINEEYNEREEENEYFLEYFLPYGVVFSLENSLNVILTALLERARAEKRIVWDFDVKELKENFLDLEKQDDKIFEDMKKYLDKIESSEQDIEKILKLKIKNINLITKINLNKEKNLKKIKENLNLYKNKDFGMTLN